MTACFVCRRCTRLGIAFGMQLVSLAGCSEIACTECSTNFDRAVMSSVGNQIFSKLRAQRHLQSVAPITDVTIAAS